MEQGAATKIRKEEEERGKERGKKKKEARRREWKRQDTHSSILSNTSNAS